ncbi:MAG: DUF2203 domain-containing protein [Deltaproteobacteria bacterium]|nr:DUF2203 domain-containing protein [Deltaproteobacteria bacterium]
MHFLNAPLPLRYFTPDEANVTLREVQAYLEGAIDLEHKIRQLEQESPPTDDRAHKIENLRDEANRFLAKIANAGVDVKGLRQGLLDFPALRNGELVYLCWQVGEARVEHWHTPQAGFQGRVRIEAPKDVRWAWRN